jgi:osmotically inducible lipoprotein OsmB
MRSTIIAVFACATLAIAPACTNMSKTQQGALSGGAIGAAAGAGISAIAGGSVGLGVLLGGGLGAVAGGVYGHEKEKK